MNFFFSSRGRHTSWPRDWSSDVCSSDLSTLLLISKLLAMRSSKRNSRLFTKASTFNLNGYFQSCHRMPAYFVRSEEHTSELQSRGHLVCRLLLEKKKKGELRRLRGLVVIKQ